MAKKKEIKVKTKDQKKYNLFKINLIILIVLLVLVLYFVLNVKPTIIGNAGGVIGVDFSSPIAAFQLDKTSMTFTSLSETQTLLVSTNDSKVYKNAYYSTGTTWNKFQLSGTTLSSGWITGAASKTLSLKASDLNLNDTNLTKTLHIITYSCTKLSRNKFDCRNNLWQLKDINVTYTGTPTQAATPVASPVAGTYTSAQSVTLTSATSGASIYYTTNGSTPTTSSTLYSSAIAISATTTLKAIATKSGYTNSSVLTSVYTINSTTTPLTIEGTVVVNTETGLWYGVEIPNNVPTALIYRNNSITSSNFEAYMLHAGDEEVSSSNNNLDGEIITGNKLVWNGTDMTSITHGLFTGYNINAIIKYNYLDRVPMGIVRKSNGMTDVSGVIAYNIIKDPNVGVVMKGMNGVKIYNNTFYNSRTTADTSRAFIDVYANPSPYAPSTGTKIYNNVFYTKHQTFNISVFEAEDLVNFESNYNIFYCEDGAPMFKVQGSPRTFAQWQALGYDLNSIVINPNFIDTINFVPSARLNYGTNLDSSLLSGLSTSAVWGTTSPATTNQNGTWQVGARVFDSSSSVVTPVASPVAGTYTSVQNVTLTSATSGASIYYTTNGSTPTTSSTLYSSAIAISATTTLKAIATKSGMTNSSVLTATYTINTGSAVEAPIATPAAGTITAPKTIALSSATSGATIYYTTDGTTPTIKSTQYTNPIYVLSTQTLKAIAVKSGLSNSSVLSSTYTMNLPANHTYYVATNGSDSANGDINHPFATWDKLKGVVVAGDLVYIRGGVYRSPKTTATTKVNWTNLTGNANNYIRIWAYPGEYPVLNLDDMVVTDNTYAVSDALSKYVWFKGLRVTGLAQDPTGATISFGWVHQDSSNMILENIELDHIGGFGFVNNGSGAGLANNNLYYNCDVHHCDDRYSVGDPWGGANGFNQTGGSDANNTYYIGCRAWWISDDGWDMFRGNGFTVIENSWAFWNGYEPGTFTPCNGNGIGFKMGPSTIPGQTNSTQKILKNCVAFENKFIGFNDNQGDYPDVGARIELYNNTSYKNADIGFHFGNGVASYILKNNISYDEYAYLGNANTIQSNNSWTSGMGITLNASDFMSISSVGMDGPRKADGSLPDVTFLHLVTGSDLIDKGTTVGIAYNGTAPDLGAFEK